MKKIIYLLRRPFRTEYRLTVLYLGDGFARNTYAAGRHGKRILLHMAERLTSYQYWTLYKRGPMGLPEREIAGKVGGE